MYVCMYVSDLCNNKASSASVLQAKKQRSPALVTHVFRIPEGDMRNKCEKRSFFNDQTFFKFNLFRYPHFKYPFSVAIAVIVNGRNLRHAICLQNP